MRRGELAALQWDRVNFALKQITVTRTRDIGGCKETTKSNRRRVIPMNSVAMACLLKLFKKRTDASAYVFTKNQGELIDVHHLPRVLKKAQEDAGINNRINVHGLRHTFASQFMMNGGNIYDLQKILGHSELTHTLRYAHCSQEHLQKAISGFELGITQDGFAQKLPMQEEFVENVVCL